MGGLNPIYIMKGLNPIYGIKGHDEVISDTMQQHSHVRESYISSEQSRVKITAGRSESELKTRTTLTHEPTSVLHCSSDPDHSEPGLLSSGRVEQDRPSYGHEATVEPVASEDVQAL